MLKNGLIPIGKGVGWMKIVWSRVYDNLSLINYQRRPLYAQRWKAERARNSFLYFREPHPRMNQIWRHNLNTAHSLIVRKVHLLYFSSEMCTCRRRNKVVWVAVKLRRTSLTGNSLPTLRPNHQRWFSGEGFWSLRLVNQHAHYLSATLSPSKSKRKEKHKKL